MTFSGARMNESPLNKLTFEQALAELGYKDTIIFRPAALSATQRSDSRPAERALL